jgi:hypothetical protein
VRQRIAVAALVAAMGCAVVGCGGGGDSTASGAPLTRAEFIKQGDAICIKVGIRVAKAFERNAGKKKAATRKGEREEITEMSIPAFQKELEEFSELTPPKGSEKVFATIVAGLESGVEDMEAHPDRPLTTDPNGQFYTANQAEVHYGFHVCGR